MSAVRVRVRVGLGLGLGGGQSATAPMERAYLLTSLPPNAPYLGTLTLARGAYPNPGTAPMERADEVGVGGLELGLQGHLE